jgi:hypothetical protein
VSSSIGIQKWPCTAWPPRGAIIVNDGITHCVMRQ